MRNKSYYQPPQVYNKKERNYFRRLSISQNIKRKIGAMRNFQALIILVLSVDIRSKIYWRWSLHQKAIMTIHLQTSLSISWSKRSNSCLEQFQILLLISDSGLFLSLMVNLLLCSLKIRLCLLLNHILFLRLSSESGSATLCGSLLPSASLCQWMWWSASYTLFVYTGLSSRINSTRVRVTSSLLSILRRL